MQCLDDGYDIAIGSSREGPGARRYGEPVYRHLMGRVFNLAVRLITGSPYRDTQCGFKLFRAEAARDIFSSLRLYAENAEPVFGPMVTGLDVEVLQVARRRGYRVREIGVEWYYGRGSRCGPCSTRTICSRTSRRSASTISAAGIIATQVRRLYRAAPVRSCNCPSRERVRRADERANTDRRRLAICQRAPAHRARGRLLPARRCLRPLPPYGRQ